MQCTFACMTGLPQTLQNTLFASLTLEIFQKLMNKFVTRHKIFELEICYKISETLVSWLLLAISYDAFHGCFPMRRTFCTKWGGWRLLGHTGIQSMMVRRKAKQMRYHWNSWGGSCWCRWNWKWHRNVFSTFFYSPTPTKTPSQDETKLPCSNWFIHGYQPRETWKLTKASPENILSRVLPHSTHTVNPSVPLY